MDDLHWLGLDWDQGPDIGGPFSPYDQTLRVPSYRLILESLIAQERVYPCDCSRSEIAASASAPHEALEGPIYSGHCRHRLAADAKLLKGSDFAWRFRASHDVRVLNDAIAGTHQANVAQQLGDFIVAKGDGTPAYQLAVVADDFSMGITEVLRGDDLIPSCFRQLDLLAALGWPQPTYLHVPLMVGSDGRRLAKRHGDTRISWFRERGYCPDRIIGYLAWTAGLVDKDQAIAPRELIASWSPDRVHRHPTVVDLAELLARL